MKAGCLFRLPAKPQDHVSGTLSAIGAIALAILHPCDVSGKTGIYLKLPYDCASCPLNALSLWDC
jgi:hypothetical protein